MKTSKAKNEILDILQGADKPLCYDDFDLNIDKATFYRNIAKFESENVIQKLESDERKWYFELKTTPHAHFLCTTCKQIVCIKDYSPSLQGFQIDTVTFKGTCPSCLANQ